MPHRILILITYPLRQDRGDAPPRGKDKQCVIIITRRKSTQVVIVRMSPNASRAEVPHNACCYRRRSGARTVRGVLRRASRLGSCGASSRDRRSSAVASDHLIALPCGLLTLRFITVDPAHHVVGDVGEMPSLTAGENAI